MCDVYFVIAKKQLTDQRSNDKQSTYIPKVPPMGRIYMYGILKLHVYKSQRSVPLTEGFPCTNTDTERLAPLC